MFAKAVETANGKSVLYFDVCGWRGYGVKGAKALKRKDNDPNHGSCGGQTWDRERQNWLELTGEHGGGILGGKAAK